MGDHVWTPQDNMIGQAELQLSTILTRELTSRPEVTLKATYMSLRVQGEVLPILLGLEEQIGKRIKVSTQAYKEPDGTRSVTVTIHVA